MDTITNRIILLWTVSVLFLFAACSDDGIEYKIITSETEYFNDKEINEILQQSKKNNALTILWFSDIHGDSRRLGRIVRFKQYFDSIFSDILHSGDNVVREYSDGMSFWDSVSGTNKILNVIGNHDASVITNGKYNWKAKSGLDCYNQYIAPYVMNWRDVVFPSDAATTGKCYYYKDYIYRNIRLIVLDCMVMGVTDANYDSSQITWFKSVLLDAKKRISQFYYVLIAHPNQLL